MVRLEKSNEILEKRLKQVGDEIDTDGKVVCVCMSVCVCVVCVCVCVCVHACMRVVRCVRACMCEISMLGICKSLLITDDLPSSSNAISFTCVCVLLVKVHCLIPTLCTVV